MTPTTSDRNAPSYSGSGSGASGGGGDGQVARADHRIRHGHGDLPRHAVGVAVDGVAVPRNADPQRLAGAAWSNARLALAHVAGVRKHSSDGGQAGGLRAADTDKDENEEEEEEDAATAAAAALHDAPTGGAFLNMLPEGAYTTMRTMHAGTAVLSLSFHARRLVESARLIRDARREHGGVDAAATAAAVNGGRAGMSDVAGAGLAGVDSWLTDEHEMRQRLVRSVRAALPPPSLRDPADTDERHSEFWAMALIPHHNRGRHHVYVRCAPLPLRSVPPGRRGVVVEARGTPRPNPAAKDSAWLRARAPLERAQSRDADETVLVDADGYIREGMTSNFFVVERVDVSGTDGGNGGDDDDLSADARIAAGIRVVTAGDGVLVGHVRELVLRACKRRGVRVQVAPAPHVRDAARWREVFLTGTTRIVLPVERVRFATGDGVEHRADWVLADGVGECGTDGTSLASTRSATCRIRRWVAHEMELAFEPLK